ncbi:hypothetical protein SAMN05192533_103188 [Mesobacillus persicus]|uniref:Uncharacterized protein n=1 Tax=Mesobacillus persicus TaxID=930146 RepID=A0A1H7YY81_9BACI|nr:hypothetical protein SAMN05192533_103188 [Mesobacillus persicus]
MGRTPKTNRFGIITGVGPKTNNLDMSQGQVL